MVTSRRAALVGAACWVALWAVASSTGCDSKPTDIDQLEEDVAQLQAENDSLRARVDALDVRAREVVLVLAAEELDADFVVHDSLLVDGDTRQAEMTFAETHLYRFSIPATILVEIRLEGASDISFVLLRENGTSLERIAEADQDLEPSTEGWSDLSVFERALAAGDYIILVETFADFDSYQLTLDLK